jgi:hypothetical protein
VAISRRAQLRSIANERKLKRRLRRESTLPTWKTQELGKGQLGIQCPREGCAGKAKVNKRRWLDSKPEYETRCCTYCYAAAWIPEDLL